MSEMLKSETTHNKEEEEESLCRDLSAEAWRYACFLLSLVGFAVLEFAIKLNVSIASKVHATTSTILDPTTL